jgi:hypothetical protein
MSAAPAMTEHSAQWQQKEQGEEHNVPAGDHEHQRGEKQRVEREPHQNARRDALAV